MFVGTHTPRLDDKGRLILPAKYREQLADGLVLTPGGEHCLYVWTTETFTQMTQNMRPQGFMDREAREFQRKFFGRASDEVPDKQGRVTIPGHLRAYAGLERECVVLGAWDRLELWDATRWAEHSADHDDSFADMSHEVMPGFS